MEGYAVWIDYNQNGVFGDAGELVYGKTIKQPHLYQDHLQSLLLRQLDPLR
jgi:hypothetical protein